MNIDLAIVARDLKLPPDQIQKTVELLDEGNSIPFITRFRKDQTGGLNEQQILGIKQRVAQLRALAERKGFVVKSIESQGKLTDELKTLIEKATSNRKLEDLYHPFKPKKQSRATVARQQGLEPLAEDIFAGGKSEAELSELATKFVRVDKELKSVDDVFKGVVDLLAEQFADNNELRQSIRQILLGDGVLTSTLIAQPEDNPSESQSTDSKPEVDAPSESAEQPGSGTPVEAEASDDESKNACPSDPSGETIAGPEADVTSEPAEPQGEAATEAESTQESAQETDANTVASDDTEVQSTENVSADADTTVSPESEPADPAAQTESVEAKANLPKKKKKKKKKKKTADDPFKDYHDFKQAIKSIPHYRVLALNRGERANRIKVKLLVENDKIQKIARETLVPTDHTSAEFLTRCADEAVNELILPSLEREIRRELTESAEQHAVEVFADNLKNLLLQAPIRNKCVLAIDPGFKRGCSVAILDRHGNMLESGAIFVVGNQKRRDDAKQKIVKWCQTHSIDLIAIGNGAACRQTEAIVSEALADELKETNVKYVMVNEAGTSTYSTSEIAREELPEISPATRSAISIARRLQDPLYELVKISPANIGVGMYQHDIKAKHLSDSLDEVVSFCVNQVGVDVNNATPALLKYVSGLNALTARRIVEHRNEIGGFKNREQLKSVNGIGDTTFLQSAGFIRVYDGDHPLDQTSIHPENYELAEKIVTKVGGTLADLFPMVPVKSPESNTAKPEGTSNSDDSKEEPLSVAPAAADQNDNPNTAEDNGSLNDSKTDSADDTNVTTGGDASTEDPSVESGSPPETPPTVESTDAGELSDSSEIAHEQPSPQSENETAGSESLDEGNSNTTSGESSEAKPTSVAMKLNLPKLRIDFGSPTRRELVRKLGDLDYGTLATEFNAGRMLIRDIVLALKRPDWDPREKTAKPVFRRGILNVADLKKEMELDAQVVNVVDFGVFVDIGLGESSLIHVSQLSHQFIRDPHRRFTIGDALKVWVTEIDTERKRVKLTAIRPGSKKPSRGKPSRRTGQSAEGRRGKPRGKGKSGGGKPDRAPRKDRKPRKPKPVTPITDGMLKGDEPMRSFSDLAQFVTRKSDDKKDK